MNGNEGAKDVIPVEGEERKPSIYDEFVEGVATRDIARGHGVDPMATARVFKQVDENGEVIHLAGRKDVVEGIADTLEKGGYKVKEWHIKRPKEPEKELERVAPEMEMLFKESPAQVLDRLAEGLRSRLGLPSTPADKFVGKLVGRKDAEEEVSEAVEEAAKAIKEFSGGGEKHGEETG